MTRRPPASSSPSPSGGASRGPSAPARPLGLTLLTTYDGVMAGVIPAIATYLRYFGQPPDARPSVLVVFAVFLLSAGLITAAASTWRGETTGRVGLLVLTTIYYTGLMVDAPYTVDLAAHIHGPDATWERALRVGRSVFWIGLHGWYLLFGPGASFVAASSSR